LDKPDINQTKELLIKIREGHYQWTTAFRQMLWNPANKIASKNIFLYIWYNPFAFN